MILVLYVYCILQDHFSRNGQCRRKLVVHTVPTKKGETAAEGQEKEGGGEEEKEDGGGGEKEKEGGGGGDGVPEDEVVEETDFGEPIPEVRLQFKHCDIKFENPIPSLLCM